jgi:hypothetical protein
VLIYISSKFRGQIPSKSLRIDEFLAHFPLSSSPVLRVRAHRHCRPVHTGTAAGHLRCSSAQLRPPPPSAAPAWTPTPPLTPPADSSGQASPPRALHASTRARPSQHIATRPPAPSMRGRTQAQAAPLSSAAPAHSASRAPAAPGPAPPVDATTSQARQRPHHRARPPHLLHTRPRPLPRRPPTSRTPRACSARAAPRTRSRSNPGGQAAPIHSRTSDSAQAKFTQAPLDLHQTTLTGSSGKTQAALPSASPRQCRPFHTGSAGHVYVLCSFGQF